MLSLPGALREEPWESRAVDLFESRMLDSDELFPCIFGVDAVRRRTLRYGFAPSGPRQVGSLIEALREFAANCVEFGRRTSLVIFFEDLPGGTDVEGCRKQFWSLLEKVTAVDSHPWPHDVDPDPESPTWEFSCFGVPFFVVVNTPYHHRRRSRHFDYFAITFQPRFVFDDLHADSPAGTSARKIIRERLASYDNIERFRDLGSFGDAENREWVQYFLPDDGSTIPREQRCPLRAKPTEDNGMTRSTGPEFIDAATPVADLPPGIADLLPPQGSIEIQNDGPRKLFTWHEHSVDEELLILEGEATLYWAAPDGTYQERLCKPGSDISLPVGTVHGSLAGASGCVYIIRPLGPSPTTRFLTEDEWPFTPPAPGNAAAASTCSRPLSRTGLSGRRGRPDRIRSPPRPVAQPR